MNNINANQRILHRILCKIYNYRGLTNGNKK